MKPKDRQAKLPLEEPRPSGEGGGVEPPPAAPPPEGPPPARSRLKVILGALALAALIAYLAFTAGKLVLLDLRAAGGGPEVLVEIPRGSGLAQTTAILEKSGVVDRPWLFQVAARLTGQGSRIKAGEYRLSPGLTNRQILTILSEGRVALHSLTIPEGYTMAQIFARAGELRLLDPEEAARLARDPQFLASVGLEEALSLEGFLFPTTYLIPRGLGTRRVLGLMVRRFHQHWDPLAPRARAVGLSMREAVTLASIIERETSLDDERALVSAVYHNRLKKGMRLQADPTVIYGLSDFDGRLTRDHLSQDSPYNTYTRAGLPPGPICSPGLASLRAAVSPAGEDYLYFVAKGDGGHTFSTNYRAHAQAVRRLRRSRR